MTEVVDLNSAAGYFSPLPLSPQHRRALKKALIRAIRAVPFASREILSTYSPSHSEWEVPPLFSGELEGASLQVAADKVKFPNKQNPCEGYKLLLETYKKYKWHGNLSLLLRNRFGELADSPLVFCRMGSTLERFAVELTVAMSASFRTNSIINDSSLALQVFNGTELDYIGIINDEVIFTDRTLERGDLLTWLLSPRGLVITKSYGVYDRMLLWTTQNYGALEQADKIRTALSLLKLSGNLTAEFDLDEVEFEHELRKMKEVEPPKKAFGSPLSYDRFVEIRALWVETKKSQEDAFLDLLEALVPNVYDSERFKQLFGSLPDIDKPLTDRQIVRIDRGIVRFTEDYSRMERGTK